MADSTEGHTDVRYLDLLVPALIVLIAGLVIHSFIIGVNVTDWWKGRSVTPVDHIITSLGISRMCSQYAFTLYVFLISLFFIKLDSPITVIILATVYIFFVYANGWLTTLLSIVLCLKISNFHSRLFLYLRGMIVHRTAYFIVVSGLLSTASCLMPLLKALTDGTTDGANNITISNLYRSCISSKAIHNYIIVGSIPTIFSCISSVLLFSSLYHHTAKMKMSSNLSINLETYYSVMRFVFFTFIYSILYVVGQFVVYFYYFSYCDRLLWLRIVSDFLPVLHSSYLIYRTPKVRSHMSKGLQIITDFLPPKTDTETGENIQM